MRAVIIATGESAGIKPLDEHYPTPLLPLIDRPFIQHVVEYYAAQGMTRVDFVLSRFPEKIEHHLEDGTRWGTKFNFHLARDPSFPYRVLKALDWSGEDGPILFGHADRLALVSLREAAASPARPVLFSSREPGPLRADAPPFEGASGRWTGWALVLPEHLAALPAGADEAGLYEYLRKSAVGGSPCFEVPRPLGVRTFEEFFNAHRVFLAKKAPGLRTVGREADPGVWLARNVRLHPSVRFFPPVCVGENCDVGPGVRLGPDAVLGKDCVLDGHCTVINSVVFPGSYVGEGLELADVLVDKNRLISLRLGGAVDVSDNFLLGSIAERHLSRWFGRALARAAALAALLLASPLLLALALCLKLFRRGPVLYRKDAVRLPAAAEEVAWGTFPIWSFSPIPAGGAGAWGRGLCSLRGLVLRFLPALVSVVRGDLTLVGVPPRTSDEVKQLPHDWKALYLRARAGIVTEASVRPAADFTDDDLYASDAVYAACAGWAYELKLLARYLIRSVFGPLFPKYLE
jgi:lipopolysaccharide/colanic/teichoic acid biosynthesis glycosyltransferase